MKNPIRFASLALVPLVLVLVLSGCYLRFNEGADSPFAQYVGRQATVKRTVLIYDYGILGALGAPAGEWPVSKGQQVKATLEPGAVFEVVGASSRRIESGKHYYLACRYHAAGEEVLFDYPADGQFIGAAYLSFR